MFHKHAQAPALPVTDYHAAIAGAVEWLGDRYLLARPITAVKRPQRFEWQGERASRRRYQQWLTRFSSSRAS